MSEPQNVWESAAAGDPTAQALVAFFQEQATPENLARRALVAECADMIISEAHAAGQPLPDATDLAIRAWQRASAQGDGHGLVPTQPSAADAAWVAGFLEGLREGRMMPAPDEDL
ncbi:MAG TPA: hypothetical protein VM536_13075 [Chloroflexia bacterium]|nr:hypothetical protein [Chloroflexia bacterium]